MYTVFDSLTDGTVNTPFVSVKNAVRILHWYRSHLMNTLIYRGEWDVDYWTWLNIMTQNSIGVSLRVWLVRGWSLIGSFRHQYVLRFKWDKCDRNCHAGRWAAMSQWYWLDWNTMQVIMIVRLYAMYQRSRMILVFLVVVFLAVNIACGVITIIGLMDTVGGRLYLLTWRTQLIGWTPEEMILYGTYMCAYGPRTSSEEDIVPLLTSIIWVLNTVWEVPALCLAVWIAVKHFRDLRRLGQSTIEDCFRALIKSHVLYFARWACDVNMVIFFSSSARASFAGVSCVQLAYVFPAFFVRRPVANIF